jgi:hypothetical protein
MELELIDLLTTQQQMLIKLKNQVIELKNQVIELKHNDDIKRQYIIRCIRIQGYKGQIPQVLNINDIENYLK